MKKTLLIAALITLSGCTDAPRATEAIKNMGLEPISVGGYSFFSCSGDDFSKTKFTAKRPDGKLIKGTVCAGLFFKGATVRFN